MMKKIKVTQEELDTLNIGDAKKLGKILFEERLRLDWLQLRLNRDWGLDVKTSYLSEIVNGKRDLGKRTALIVWCCTQVLYEYREHYPKNRR